MSGTLGRTEGQPVQASTLSHGWPQAVAASARGRLLLRGAITLGLVALVAWYLRLFYLEGYLYRVPSGFYGDFQAALKLQSPLFAGQGLFYGPIFILEWRYLWLPGYMTIPDFEYVDYLLYPLAFLACWWALFPRRDVRLFLLVLLLWLAHGAPLDAFADGAHPELLELLFLSVALLCFTRQQTTAGGVSLGLAIATKTLPGFFLPYLALRRQWRALAAAVIVAAAFLVVASVVQGVSPLEGAGDLVFQGGNLTKVQVHWYELAIRDDIARTLTGREQGQDIPAAQAQTATLLSSILAAVVTVVAGWVVWRRRWHGPRQEGVLFGLVATVMLIAAPSLHTFYFLFLFPGWTALLALLLERRFSRSTALIWAGFLLSYTFSGFDTPFLVAQKLLGVGEGFVEDWGQLHLYSLAMLVNLVVCIGALLTEPEDAPEAASVLSRTEPALIQA